MSKKYQGKRCVYCASAPSTTADHVIARGFFLTNRCIDLPKVPACQRCQREKAQLEHHLTAVLPFGGRHADAEAALRTMVPKRLARNRRLHQMLLTGLRQRAVRHPDADLSQRTALTIPFDSSYFKRLFAMITKGLVWYHWRTMLGPGTSVRAEAISETWAQKYGELFTVKSHGHVKKDLGEGTFCYEGLQAEKPRELTLWRFSIYGGICLAGDPKSPHMTSTQVLAITGPSADLQKLEPALFGDISRLMTQQNQPAPLPQTTALERLRITMFRRSPVSRAFGRFAQSFLIEGPA